MEPLLPKLVADATKTLQSLLKQEQTFEKAAAAAIASLRAGGTIFTCGNGGSAADAMHLAEELIGRYRSNRRPLAAVCLNADPTALTCIANDFSFEDIFSRQVEGLAGPNDLLVCFSTSGKSPNILRALAATRTAGAKSLALLGRGGGPAKGQADFEIVIDSQDTARIQEVHTLILHALLERIEEALA